MKGYKKIAKSLNEFLKESSKPVEKKAEVIKTAEDEELYRKGKIFGMGMAEGFLEKIAQELEQVEPKLPPAQPAEPVVAPQQVPATAASSDLESIKALIRKMTPAQLAEWLLEQDPETLKLITEDPDLASMVDEALRALDQNLVAPEEEEASEEAESSEE